MAAYYHCSCTYSAPNQCARCEAVAQAWAATDWSMTALLLPDVELLIHEPRAVQLPEDLRILRGQRPRVLHLLVEAVEREREVHIGRNEPSVDGSRRNPCDA